MDLSTGRYFEYLPNDEIPIAGVRSHTDDAFGRFRNGDDEFPTEYFQNEFAYCFHA